MKKIISISLLVLLCFSMVALFIEVPTVQASTATLTFTTSTSDDDVWDFSSFYSIVHDMTSGSISSNATSFTVGQYLPPGTYVIYRSYVFFDTSAIPDGATIDSAILSVNIQADYSDTDFNVQIQSGAPTYPHDPLAAGDYYYQHYSGDGGSRSTSEISGVGYWNITLSATGEGWISKTGATKLCLRSSNDINSVAPSGNEYVQISEREQGESYVAKLYVEYSVPSRIIAFSSSPEINAEFTVNGTNYNTPSYVDFEDGNTAHITAESAKIYGGEGWFFDRWLINGTTTYYEETIDLTITGDTTIVIYYANIPNLYHFYGPYDEETGYLLDENVTVSAYYATSPYPNYVFEFNGSWAYPPDTNVQFFQFNFTNGKSRQYWVDYSELVTSIYIFKADTTEYTINFLDTTSILKTYPYITIKRYVNGTLYTVEKRKVDVYNSIIANLIYTRTYQITLGNEETTYVFGDFLATAQTTVQLVLRGVDFPKETLFLQKYVRIYGQRDFTTNSIILYYNDTAEATINIDIFIFYANGTNAYAGTITADSFVFEWTNAEDDRTYQVKVYIHHNTYGTLKWNQLLLHGNTEPPFSLAFLGNWGFDSAYLLPAIIIICVAGCFSALNAYVGAILACLTAIILTGIGWIPIPIGALVAAIFFAVLMALIHHKRSVTVY